MIRVSEILEVNTQYIVCRLSDNQVKRLDLLPLIKRHAHLKGIDKLNNPVYVKKAGIGIFGEIFWPKTITCSDNKLWNYDISPEFIAESGEDYPIYAE